MNIRQDSVDRCIVDTIARYPVIDPLVEGVVDRISAIAKHHARIFEETLSGLGLSLGEYKLLLQIAVAAPPGRPSAGDLSRALLLSSGGMTNRLDRLEKAGLIRRLPDPDDRRGVLVELTSEGSALIDQAVADEARKEIVLFGSLSKSKLSELNALLRTVLHSLEEPFGPHHRTGATASSSRR